MNGQIGMYDTLIHSSRKVLGSNLNIWMSHNHFPICHIFSTWGLQCNEDQQHTLRKTHSPICELNWFFTEGLLSTRQYSSWNKWMQVLVLTAGSQRGSSFQTGLRAGKLQDSLCDWSKRHGRGTDKGVEGQDPGTGLQNNLGAVLNKRHQVTWTGNARDSGRHSGLVRA